ncbi:MAG: zinc-dependent metalloprotease [Propionicimonas sp.]
MQQLPFIDWDAAARVGRKAVHPGPELTPGGIAEVVDALRAATGRATSHVLGVTGMAAPAHAKTLIVDRAGWISAMSVSAGALLGALGAPTVATTTPQRLAGRVMAGNVGAGLAVVASRILGQFDPFAEPKRLLLVAPNVVATERKLGVNPTDFRLWICLHEETHRVQFGQAPWLVGHLQHLMRELLAEDEPLRQWRAGQKPHSLVDLMTTPAQHETFDRITAVMSLMEGHADVMMDRVGTAVLPTLPVIRRAFEAHRDRTGWAAIVSKLLGLDLKRAQYRDGAAFCNEVLRRADLETLNFAFSAADQLPTLAEIHDPPQWLHRVSR